ncbi:MAG: arginyltransferase [Gammaproteobacteria bacterium]|nr:arginyltransferase [Gammaproteobacteria bacterium]
MTDRSRNKPLPLYLSAPHACSYLPNRLSSTLFTDPEQAMDAARYAELLSFGFRRSGRMVYSPRCENCHQCVSVRIPVADFRPRRWQRRILRANQDVESIVCPASFEREHYTLYQRYTAARHGDGEMASATPADYMAFLRADWCDTQFIEFRSGGRLLAVAVTDVLDIGLSAVYTFFDPAEQARSLGTYAILQQIVRARDLGLPHHYLGYWIRDSRKMAYKTRFRPLELWREGAWQRIEAGDESVPT